VINDPNTPRVYPLKPENVYLYGTCVLDLFDPDAGMSAFELIEQEGISVHYPQEQTCCGQPAYTSGFIEQAKAVAKQQLHLFENDWPIVVPSGSCAGMMRHHWPKIFADDLVLAPLAKSIAKRVFELTEFLLHVAKVDWTQKVAANSVVLHTSCSARREMQTHKTANTLLNQIKGMDILIQDHEPECCGFGGAFSVKHPKISAAMASDKVDALEATGAKVMVSADCACLLNINGTLEKRQSPLKGQHIATYLLNLTKSTS
jgi:L-lactate dehydrogenase complex protein LldE